MRAAEPDPLGSATATKCKWGMMVTNVGGPSLALINAENDQKEKGTAGSSQFYKNKANTVTGCRCLGGPYL